MGISVPLKKNKNCLSTYLCITTYLLLTLEIIFNLPYEYCVPGVEAIVWVKKL